MPAAKRAKRVLRTRSRSFVGFLFLHRPPDQLSLGQLGNGKENRAINL